VNTYGYVSGNPVDGTDAFGLCDKGICGLKKAPEYDHSGQVELGKWFKWDAEFLNDANHDPMCCEVRQLIFWNRCWSSARCAFTPYYEPPRDQPGNWYEDRDPWGGRYGRRDGPHSQPHPGDYYEGDKYFGWDQPDGPFNGGFFLKFRLIVVDRCRGGKTIFTSKTLQVNF
jgi:hypothetical protein